MRGKTLLLIAAMLVAVPLFAATSKIFSAYETTRQALLKTSVADVQSSAKQLAAEARAEKEDAIAVKADVLAQAKDLAAARTAFAALSDEVIKYRATAGADGTVVAYCPMRKVSWVQPKGAISNPYLDAGMRSCGSIRK